MKKLVMTWLCTVFVLVPALASAADRVGDFALLDQHGYFHQMSWCDDHGAIALFVQANGSVASINSMAEFERALKATLAGQPIANPAVVATTGDSVRYPARLAHRQVIPSYEDKITPVISENCAACHREGGIAPFAMNNHAMVKAWAPMIREVLMTKRMPPGQVDPHIGEFVNGGIVADSDIQKLLHWIEAGAPSGTGTDPLAELTWPETKWAFGEPDAIIKVPPQSIPATGALPKQSR